VEEVPLYTPCGEGTHLYLFVEKVGMPTLEAVHRLARALNKPKRDFGVAGLKDAAATTRQYISIEHVNIDEVAALDVPGVRVIKAAYHGNKLKKGHLKGNRFVITIRDVRPGAVPLAQAVLERLRDRGVPNYFGPQRFGLLGNTHILGRHLFLGEDRLFVDELITAPRGHLDPGHGEVVALYRKGDFSGAAGALRRIFRYEQRVLETLHRTGGDCRKAAFSLDRRIRELYLSAFQSGLFNSFLAQRIDLIDSIEAGDVAYLHRNGAAFVVEDVEAESPRVKSFEISPSGPLFGKKLLCARGGPGRLEEELLAAEELTLDRMSAGRAGLSLRGSRRPLRIPLSDLKLSEGEERTVLQVSFELPSGCYATVVLREIMKEGEESGEMERNQRIS
jgi:tRNA pseudouridine13 synthase